MSTKPPLKFDLVRGYWAITTILLLGAVAGIEYGFEAVLLFNIIQVVHFFLLEKSFTAFPVQVRTAYVGLLLLSQAPYMIWILWLQLVGTAAMVFFNYCLLARLLSLMPWNRTEAYSIDLIKRTFFSAPVEGNVLQGLPARTV